MDDVAVNDVVDNTQPPSKTFRDIHIVVPESSEPQSVRYLSTFWSEPEWAQRSSIASHCPTWTEASGIDYDGVLRTIYPRVGAEKSA